MLKPCATAAGPETVHITLLVWWDTWSDVVGHLDGCGEATGSVWWDTWTSAVGQPLGGFSALVLLAAADVLLSSALCQS